MATKVKSSTKGSSKSKKSTIVTNPQLPEIEDMEISKMLDVDRIDDFIEENYKKYTYTTEDEIQRKSVADKRINELKAQFVSRLNTIYVDYKDTGKETIREKADELIESYKLQMDAVLNDAMFVYKTGPVLYNELGAPIPGSGYRKAPVPTEAQVIEARKRTASVPVPVVKKVPSSYTGKEKKLIEKVRQAENYTAEINELDKQIASLDESYKNAIQEETETITNWGEKKMAEIVDRYAFKKEEEEKIQQSKEMNGLPTDKELQISMLEDAEGRELNTVQQRTIIAIITMKHKYLKMATSGVKLETKPINVVEPEEVVIQDTKLYVTSLIHHKIKVPFIKIGNNMDVYFKKYAERELEGKCRKEGYIRPSSSTIVNYSTGLLKGDSVVYDVVYSVDACFPYENMELMCKIKNITKIGIRGVISDTHNPIVLFISREHNANKNFEDYEEGQTIKIRVIGHRFELNDEFISVIGEIL